MLQTFCHTLLYKMNNCREPVTMRTHAQCFVYLHLGTIQQTITEMTVKWNGDQHFCMSSHSF